MRMFKKISLAMFGVIMFACSAFVFAGCGEDEDTSKVYVFATEGGSVQINDNTEYVRFGDEASKVFTFKEDETITLKAIPDEGYEFVKWEYTDELDEKLKYLSTKPEISLIIDDDEIVIRAIFAEDNNTHTVSYPTNSYAYTIVPEAGYTTSVSDGGTFKFKVNLKEGYTDCVITVKQNGAEITAVQGVYTIENITADVNITISGISANIYAMTFEQGTGYRLVAVEGFTENSVEYGADFKFKITLDEGYVNSVVKIKGENDLEYTQISPINGVYTISNVSKSYTIKAIADIDTFDVVLPTTGIDGLTVAFDGIVENETKVEYNKNISFSVTADENIDLTDLQVSYKIGTDTYTLDETVNGNVYTYTITNVKNNITEINISGQKIKTFNVALPIYEGLNFEFVEGGTTVEYGEDVTFSIEATDQSLDIRSIEVTCNGGDVVVTKADSKYEYTVTNVTANLQFTITASSVGRYTHTITLTGKGFTISNTETTINKGSDFVFKVSVMEGYEQVESGKTVLVNGQPNVASYDEETDTYTIKNIQADIEISVIGIQEEVVEVIYTFNIDIDFIEDTNAYPHQFTIKKSDLDAIGSNDATNLAITTDFDDVTTLGELIEKINTAMDISELNVTGFTLDGEDFIVVDMEEIFIVQTLSTDVTTYTLISCHGNE